MVRVGIGKGGAQRPLLFIASVVFHTCPDQPKGSTATLRTSRERKGRRERLPRIDQAAAHNVVQLGRHGALHLELVRQNIRVPSHSLARGLDALRRLVRPAAQVDVLWRNVHVQRPGARLVLLDQHRCPRRERPRGVRPCRTDTTTLHLRSVEQCNPNPKSVRLPLRDVGAPWRLPSYPVLREKSTWHSLRPHVWGEQEPQVW